MTAPNISANQQIARAAGTVMFAFVISNLTGLLRQILVSRAFGTQVEMDAFNAASRLPDLLFSLVAGGALASAFIPTFSEFITHNDRQGGWKLASSIANLITLILAAASALAVVFAPQLVRHILYALISGLDPSLEALTVDLLRILLLTPIIFGLSGLLMGILNTHQSFLLPALAPSMYWLGMIFGVLFLAPAIGIYGLAWGAVLGAALHLAVQLPALPALRRQGARYFATLGLALPAVREVGRLMAPRLLGAAVVQLNFIVNTILATAMSAGSLTAIQVAWAVMTMPQVVIAQAVAIAALPTFSAQVARNELGELSRSLVASLRGVLLLSLPASLGLILLRRPIISALFERGEFTALSTELVAWALLWYAAGLVGHSLLEVLVRAFYALHDTRTPVLVGAGAMGLNILLSLLFSAMFANLGWAPHGGLALANSLATALEVTGLAILMRRKLGRIDGQRLFYGGLQAALAVLIMSAALLLWLNFSASQPAWLVGTGGVMLGGLVYGVAALVLGIGEARSAAGAMLRRLAG